MNRIEYNCQPIKVQTVANKDIYVFHIPDQNIDQITVDSFGEEWTKFNSFTDAEIKLAGDQYFDIVPAAAIAGKNILDMGCGTGRWSKYLCSRAGSIEAIDPSEAVVAAARLLQNENNVRIAKASVDSLPFDDNSFDLVFSLGVLHHIPDTQKAMANCIKKLKVGGYFVVYLYYNLDNRGMVFKLLFGLSNLLRLIISKMPSAAKKAVCDFLAITMYMPFVTISRLVIKMGLPKVAKAIPLSYYADKSFTVIRNDALDRFGTPLEQRFSKKEIEAMMAACGLTEIVFSEKQPFWHATGKKK